MSNEAAPILRAVDAAFARDGVTLVAPFSLLLGRGGQANLETPDERVASLRARMLAGIVKATSGTLSIGDFDPRIQPVQAKRLIGFVSAGIVTETGEHALDRATIDTYADLWQVDRTRARAAAGEMLARLGTTTPYARSLALALIRPVAVLVLDRPPPGFEFAVAQLGLTCAIVSSRTATAASALPAQRTARIA